MRLIDADKLKESFNNAEVCNGCPDAELRCNYDCKEPDFLTDGIERVIDMQPTVDAVPVVYCEECTLFGNCIPAEGMLICGIEHGYCAAGKRKEVSK